MKNINKFWACVAGDSLVKAAYTHSTHRSTAGKWETARQCKIINTKLLYTTG